MLFSCLKNIWMFLTFKNMLYVRDLGLKKICFIRKSAWTSVSKSGCFKRSSVDQVWHWFIKAACNSSKELNVHGSRQSGKNKEFQTLWLFLRDHRQKIIWEQGGKEILDSCHKFISIFNSNQADKSRKQKKCSFWEINVIQFEALVRALLLLRRTADVWTSVRAEEVGCLMWTILLGETSSC